MDFPPAFLGAGADLTVFFPDDLAAAFFGAAPAFLNRAVICMMDFRLIDVYKKCGSGPDRPQMGRGESGSGRIQITQITQITSEIAVVALPVVEPTGRRQRIPSRGASCIPRIDIDRWPHRARDAFSWHATASSAVAAVGRRGRHDAMDSVDEIGALRASK